MINQIVTSVVSITAFAVIARLVSRSEMGELAVLVLLTSASALISGLGIVPTSTKFVASLDGHRDKTKMRKAAYDCLIITATITTFVVLVVYGSAEPIAAFLMGSKSRAPLIKILSLEIASTSMDGSLIGVLTGMKRFREISLTNMSSFALRQSLVVVFLLLGYGLPGVVIGWGIGDSIAAIILGSFAKKFLGPFSTGFGRRKLLKFSAPLFLGQAANYAWTWFDRALLIPLVSLAQLGSYNVAVTAFGLLNALPNSISGTLFPFYSRMYARRTASTHSIDLEKSILTASRYVAFFTIPLAVGLAVTAFPAATLFAGAAYADAAYPLAVLSISLGLACFEIALSQIFVVMERTTTFALVIIASIIVPIVVGIAVIPVLGIIGAAFVRGLSIILVLVFSVFVLKRISSVRFDVKAYRQAWIASLAMAAAVFLVQNIYYSKFLFPIYVAVGAAVFILVARKIHAVDSRDMKLLSEFLGVRFNPVVRQLARILDIELHLAE